MRVPSYRSHSSGQARVTLNGKDHLLGTYGSPESKAAYGRLIAEFNASNWAHVSKLVPIRCEDSVARPRLLLWCCNLDFFPAFATGA